MRQMEAAKAKLDDELDILHLLEDARIMSLI